MKKKQVRRKAKDPRGGFFRMYSEAWLNDKELIDAGDDAQAGYVRLMAGVNEIDFVTGTFHTNGYPLPKVFILDLAHLTDQVFTKLEQMGKIKKDDKDIYYLPNWEKYQDKSRLYGNDYRIDAPHDALGDARVDVSMTAPRKEEGKKGIKEEDKNIKKEKATTTPSASPQAVFVDWFKLAYQSRHGKPYADTKADYIQMAPVLKSFNNNFEMLKQLVEAGWNTPDEKNGYSIAGQCMTVKGFCSVVNKIVLQKSAPKTAYQIKQEALNAKQNV